MYNYIVFVEIVKQKSIFVVKNICSVLVEM